MREQRGQQLLTSSRGRLDYAISEPCAVSCWLNLPAFLGIENSLYCYPSIATLWFPLITRRKLIVVGNPFVIIKIEAY